MAKSTKKKKEELPVIVDLSSSVPTTIVEETPIKELKTEWVTPPGLEELGEYKPIEPPKPIYRKELDANLPFEERIEAFIDSRNEGVVRMNDFLKSLYGVPQFNTPPKWADQKEMKSLGGILENMQNTGKINIQNGTHKQLGKHYYSGDDQRLSHHNLNTVTIEVKK
jgi:hypothetical protein